MNELRHDAERLRAQGIDVETVGDILGDEREPQFVMPFTPPRLGGQPAFPEPGIYFGMPEEQYHAIHALSTSGIKHLSVSSMDYWANSPLNPDRDLDENGEVRPEKAHFNFGNAIHCLVLEGEDVYRERYVVGLDKSAYPDRLETTDDIKAAIIDAGATPLTRIETGQMQPSPTKAEPDRMKPVTRTAKKEDWIAQLLDLKPDAVIWDSVISEFMEQHEGAQFVSAGTDKRVRIAARMIAAHPEIAALVTGGKPEVSVFWYCPRTGCPMKARFDYLKPGLIVDLKSFGNRGGMPIDRAIEKAIANMRYNIQHVVYCEAAEEAAMMVQATDGACIRADDGTPAANDARDWAIKWAKHEGPPEFTFIFQQTGVAPVTRGKRMPRESMGVFGVTRRRIEELKRTFIANCEVYGTDPWLDIQPITDIEDEAIPMWATEI